MDLQTLPLISADSHVEEPSTLWHANLPPSMREHLPPELTASNTSSIQFAKRIGIEDTTRTKAITDAAAAAGISDIDALRALTADPARRFEVMRRDGISDRRPPAAAQRLTRSVKRR